MGHIALYGFSAKDTQLHIPPGVKGYETHVFFQLISRDPWYMCDLCGAMFMMQNAPLVHSIEWSNVNYPCKPIACERL